MKIGFGNLKIYLGFNQAQSNQSSIKSDLITKNQFFE